MPTSLISRKNLPRRSLEIFLRGAGRFSLHVSQGGILDMGWLRFLGSITLKVNLAKETYQRDHILQKGPTI